MTHTQSHPWLATAARAAGKGLTAVGLLVGAGALTAGCLDRPVAPATPTTTNVYISEIRQTGVDKIDLVFMIDNSISMADKQEILANAVPVLVQRLIQPTCVDANGNPVGNGSVIADANTGQCAQGVAEFKPIQDIHIGIVTSSLGDHGSNDVCSDAQNQANGGGSFYNDLAQLLPSVRPGSNLYSWNNTGFLVWDPRNQADVLDPHTPITMNENDGATFIKNFTNQVIGAGEQGCGYEAQLESWYRFLVDPQPVSSMSNDGQNSVRPKMADGKTDVVNNTVLQQRANFLRPDSLLAVIMLSDENDCSIVDEDGTQGWLVGYKGGVGQVTWHMPRANSKCVNPNDPCCRPCSSPPPSGQSCADNATDPVCGSDMKNWTLSVNEDSMNERCYNQVQRFGIDLLYPPGRYVEGLSQRFITPRFGGGQVPNPIFAAGSKGEPPREATLVFLAGLIGVPWQDIATQDSLTGRNLTYMTEKDLEANGRWPVILGDPDNNVPPTDPFMIESIQPRMTGAVDPAFPSAQITPPTSTTLNPINGHEQNQLAANDDLQFACIFPLATPYTPAQCGMNPDGCDCNADEYSKNSPLCQGVTATADGTQAYAKGYPGVRELQVLKGFGTNSIVASICPKNIMPQGGNAASDPAYGYNPAVAAIVERLKEALTVKCLPRPLAPDTTGDPTTNPDFGKVPCAVVEARPQVQSSQGVYTGCPDPTCSQPGRSALTGERAKVVDAAEQFLENEGVCGGSATNAIPCDKECYCELDQFTGDDLRTCETMADPGNLYGYCYVDPQAAQATGDQTLIQGETNLVKDCAPTQKRILRFMGNGVPAKDGLAFIACIGATAGE
ncbi:MAG TPA: hypothetical protein VMI54_25775 [Polyangiaceae bacterium]|nr:hypothetical protein [Polyangiaceae bacterium]